MAVNLMCKHYQFSRRKTIPHLRSIYAGLSGAPVAILTGGGASLPGSATTSTCTNCVGLPFFFALVAVKKERDALRSFPVVAGLPYALADYNAGRANVLKWRNGSAMTNSAALIDQIGFPGPITSGTFA